MGVTSTLRTLALRYPRAGASILRAYLKRVDHVPERIEWLVQGLKRDLPLGWEQQVIALEDGSTLAIDSRSASKPRSDTSPTVQRTPTARASG